MVWAGGVIIEVEFEMAAGPDSLLPRVPWVAAVRASEFVTEWLGGREGNEFAREDADCASRRARLESCGFARETVGEIDKSRPTTIRKDRMMYHLAPSHWCRPSAVRANRTVARDIITKKEVEDKHQEYSSPSSCEQQSFEGWKWGWRQQQMPMSCAGMSRCSPTSPQKWLPKSDLGTSGQRGGLVAVGGLPISRTGLTVQKKGQTVQASPIAVQSCVAKKAVFRDVETAWKTRALKHSQ